MNVDTSLSFLMPIIKLCFSSDDTHKLCFSGIQEQLFGGRDERETVVVNCSFVLVPIPRCR